MSDEQKPREWGSGSFTTHVYAIEARAKFGAIVLKVGERFFGQANPFSNIVLTPHEWKRLDVINTDVGVPNHLELYPGAATHGFMTYPCAMALACWFQAQHESAETRLVQIEFQSSYSTKEIGIAPPMDLHEEDRQLLWYLKGQNGGKVREPIPPDTK